MLILFFAAWIIFNGRITTEIIIFGILIAALVFAFVCKFTDYSPQKERRFYQNSLSFCGYLFVLIREIYKANLAVIRQVFAHREEVEPAVVRFRTLTPGTITVSLQGDELVVHCLDKNMAEGLENSVFEQYLLKFETETKSAESENDLTEIGKGE